MFLFGCSQLNNVNEDELHERMKITDDFSSTDYTLDNYEIVIHDTGGVCEEWITTEITTLTYIITITNRCDDLGGNPYLNIEGYAFEINNYISKHYTFDESDTDILSFIGVEFVYR
jgi:hypothetical protein